MPFSLSPLVKRTLSPFLIAALLYLLLLGTLGAPLSLPPAAAAAGDAARIAPPGCFAQIDGSPTITYTTLQAAVDDAPPGSLIKVAGECTGVELRDGLRQTVHISKSLTLQGGYTAPFPGTYDPTNRAILDALGGGRVLYIAGAAVRLENLELRQGDGSGGGMDGRGGGLFLTDGQATFHNSRLDDHAASQGGALFVLSGTLELEQTRVVSSTASEGGALWAERAAVTLTSGSELAYNQATLNGGGGYLTESVLALTGGALTGNLATSHGGGLYLTGSSSLTTQPGALLAENRAQGNGGALWATGGSVSLQGSPFERNQAVNGGALWLDGSAATLNGVPFTQNEALGGRGGALFLRGGSVAVSGNQVTSNSASLDGGAFHMESVVPSIGTSQFVGNESLMAGGALSLDVAAATLTGNTFQGNRAVRGGAARLRVATLTLDGNDVRQNEAELQGGGFLLDTGVATLTGGTFQQNEVLTGTGGGLYLQAAVAEFSGTVIEENRAALDGGGLFADSGSSVVATGNTRIVHNEAITGSGGGLYVAGVSVTLAQSTLEGNRAATNGGGLYAGAGISDLAGNTVRANETGAGRGGGLYLAGSQAILSGNEVLDNRSLGRGGGIYVTNVSSATLTGNEIAGNVIAYQELTYTQLITEQIVITVTESTTTGEVITHIVPITTSNVVSTSQVISDSGGGLYLADSTALLQGNRFEGNEASANGGGLAISASEVEMVNNLVVQNRLVFSSGQGAGLYFLNSTGALLHTTVADNRMLDPAGESVGLYVTARGALSSTIHLANNIVAGHDVGLMALRGSQVEMFSMLWNNSRTDWLGNGSWDEGGRNYRGDPRFVGGNDYGILRDSAAFDIGIDAGVASDMAGTPRPRAFGIDAGAYEHRYTDGLYLDVEAAPRFLNPGNTLTYTIRVLNHGLVPMGNVQVGNALPPQQSLISIQSDRGSCSGSGCALGTLAPEEGATVVLVAEANGTVPAGGFLTMENLVTISSPDMGQSDGSEAVESYLQQCRIQLRGQEYGTLQEAVDNSHSPNDVIRVNGYCGGLNQRGGGAQSLYLDKRVTIQGGWNAAMTEVDPAQPSTLDARGLGRVLFIDGDVQPVIENFNLLNGNAATLGGGPQSKDAGGAVYIRDATATLSNTHILESSSPHLGGGLYVHNLTVPTLRNGSIRNNSAGESGGGVYLNQSDATLDGVEISDNSARAGGGLYLLKSAAIIKECAIRDNTASGQPLYLNIAGFTFRLAVGGGGGVNLDQSPATIQDCTITGNSSTVGGAVFADKSGASIVGNRIRNNTATATPVYVLGLLISAGGGGGIYGQASTLTINFNQITHNSTPGDGGGVHIYDTTSPPTVDGNVLAFNSAGRGSALFVHAKPAPPQFFVPPFTFPDFLLPLLMGLPQPDPPYARMHHNTIAHNSGGEAVFLWGESYVDFINTLVAFNSGTGIKAETEVVPYILFLVIPFPFIVLPIPFPTFHVPEANLDYSLWYENDSDIGASGVGAAVNRSHDRFGDPALKDDGYHIKRVSQGFERGRNTGIAQDIDGEARRQGNLADIGADEYPYVPFVRYVAPGGPATAGCALFSSPCGTLQAALDAADPGDLIKVAGGTYSGVSTHAGLSQVGYIDKSVTIRGGYSPTTNGTYTPLDWEISDPVANVTTLNAAGAGRVLYVTGEAAPIITGLRLTGGDASGLGGGPGGEDAGGGLYVIGASPTITNVEISGNEAAIGGGIFLSGSGTQLADNHIANNSAASGGGLFLAGAGEATITRNTIEGNTATDGGGLTLAYTQDSLLTNTIASNAALGRGGALFVVSGTATIQGNELQANGAAEGGGAYLEPGSSQIVRNSVTGNDAAAGGGFYLRAASELTIRQNRLASNTSSGHGGGLYLDASNTLLEENEVLTNSAALRGGGLYLSFSAATLQGNEIAGNSATQEGGGLYFRLSDAAVRENGITGNSASAGGGLFLRLSGATVVSNTISANSATLDGGGLALDESGARIRGNTVSGNEARSGAGIHIARSALAEVETTTLQDNVALLHGGGLYLLNSDIPLTRNRFEGNRAARGGGLYADRSLVALSGSLFTGNQATRGGGLALTNGSNGALRSNAVVDNQASNEGSGIYVENSSPALLHTTLSNNTGGTGTGIMVVRSGSEQSAVTLANTILVQQTIGLFAGEGTSASLQATLWGRGSSANSFDVMGTGSVVTGTINLREPPAFAADGYHLTEASGAIDEGIDAMVTTDLDGDSRPLGAGFDLGADEFSPFTCFARLDSEPGPVYHDLQAAVDAAQPDDIVRVAGTCTGSNTRGGGRQLLYLDRTLTITGGYSPTNWVESFPLTQPTTLDVQGEGRVLYLLPGVSPTIQNLTMTGGNAGGLGGGPGGSDAGGALYIDGATATLSNTIVSESSATYGGGLYLTGSASEIHNSQIQGNSGNRGGGLFLHGSSALLQGNRIASNTATDGAGLFLSGSDATLEGNGIHENAATSAGGGLFLEFSDATVRSNDVTTNSAQSGGGLYLDTSNATIEGNRAVANEAESGGALYLTSSGATLQGNRLLANQATSGGALYLASSNATVVNNVVARNQVTAAGGALYNVASDATFLHNSFWQNTGGVGIGLFVGHMDGNYSTTSFRNNIIAGHPIALTVSGGDSATLVGTLWYGNDANTSGAGTIDSSGEVTGDPRFANPAGQDYHLLLGSPAIDAGVSSTVGTDIDGQPRPIDLGYDIGADEFYFPELDLSLAVTPDPVLAGEEVRFNISVENTGNVTLHVALTATLPAQVSPTGPVTWSNVVIPPRSTVTRVAVGTVAPGYVGPLLGSAFATSTEGASGNASVTAQSELPAPAIAASGTTFPSPVDAGGSLRYQFRVENEGNSPLHTTVMATLPPQVTPTGVISWTGILIAPGNVWSGAVDTVVDTGASGTLTATLLATASEGVSATATIATIVRQPGLAIGQGATPEPAEAGAPLTYTIYLTNTGNIPLVATITDTLPAQVAPGGQRTWSNVTIAAGQRWTQEVAVTVAEGYVGPLVNHVAVTTAQGVGGENSRTIASTLPYLAPTIVATGNGAWDDPGSWGGSLPGPSDVVLVPAGVTLTLPGSVTVRGLSNLGQLQGPPGGPLALNATIFLYNEGGIAGGEGSAPAGAGGDLTLSAPTIDNRGTLRAGQGAAGQSTGGAGGSVSLHANDGGQLLQRGLIEGGDGGASSQGSGGAGGAVRLIARAGTISSTGILRGGRGGDGKRGGGSGGEIALLALRISGSGGIEGGDGGNVTGTGVGLGGAGGRVVFFGDYDRCPGLISLTVEATGGDGGHGNPAATSPQQGGDGGGLYGMAAPTMRLNDSRLTGGFAGIGATGGDDGRRGEIALSSGDSSCAAEPILSLAGNQSALSAGTITLFAGRSARIDLKNLHPGAIQAEGEISVAVGFGGTIDLRGNTGRVIHAGASVTLAVEQARLLLPSGWTLPEIVGSNVLVTPPAILYGSSWVGHGHDQVRAGVPLAVDLTLVNRGALTDTFTIAVSESGHWHPGGLPPTITIPGSRTTDLILAVTPPAGATVNRVQLTVVSQSDPTRVAILTLPLVAAAGEIDHTLHLPLVGRQ